MTPGTRPSRRRRRAEREPSGARAVRESEVVSEAMMRGVAARDGCVRFGARAGAMLANRCCPIRWRGSFTGMSPDEELMLIFGALHLVALACGVLLFVMFLRSDTQDGSDGPEEDEGGGGGGSDRISRPPKTSPSGGIPLPDAEPAPVRLRGHEKLADLRPRPERRRVTEPARTPHRVPERSR